MAITGDEGTVLSVDAAPYYPTSLWKEPMNIMVYNDGVPSMTLATEKDCYDVLHGIDDETLDQFFPPDAEEAYELEVTEIFVREMVTLAFLEEREELARRTFCHLKKRWEVRRAAGPSGRPRPATHMIIPVNRTVKVCFPQTTALAFHKVDRRSAALRERVTSFRTARRIEPRHVKTTAGPQRPILQPRKNS
jgi:hypothetical protein